MDVTLGARAMRAGLAFSFITRASAAGVKHDHLRLCALGQWCPTGDMSETTYLHQGFLNLATAYKV